LYANLPPISCFLTCNPFRLSELEKRVYNREKTPLGVPVLFIYPRMPTVRSYYCNTGENSVVLSIVIDAFLPISQDQQLCSISKLLSVHTESQLPLTQREAVQAEAEAV
jgi:hypothetical protein